MSAREGIAASIWERGPWMPEGDANELIRMRKRAMDVIRVVGRMRAHYAPHASLSVPL